MVHALLQVDCTEMWVGSACTQPSYTVQNAIISTTIIWCHS